MTLETIKQYEPFFGKWYIEEKLGEGSYGAVYKIRSTDYNGKSYYSALKVISIPKDENERAEVELLCGTEENTRNYFQEQLNRFETEIELMNQFKGKTNIVSYEDHEIIPREGDQIGFDVFVRMELLEDLRKIQRTNAELLNNQIEIIHIGKDICNALEICMEHNIIHRDIKPGNIMRSKDGDYKLGDFGVARNLESTSTMTKVGTLSFMAPEVENADSYDERADIYSLGMVLYELLNNNRAPFLPVGTQAVTAADKETARDLRMHGEQFPLPMCADRCLGEVVVKACAYAPEDRYQTATEFREALIQAEKMLLGTYTPGVTSGAGNSYSASPSVSQAQKNQVQPKKKSGLPIRIMAGVVSVLAAVVVALFVGVLGVQNGWFERKDAAVSASGEEDDTDDIKKSDDTSNNDDEKNGDDQNPENDPDEQKDDGKNEDDPFEGKDADSPKDQGEEDSEAQSEDDDLIFGGGQNTGVPGSSDDKTIHTYKVVMGDVTWREAFDLSREYENGYLVHINSQKEFDTVVDAIKDSGNENGFFWIGGRRFNEEEDYYWVDVEGSPAGDSLNGKSFWLSGEPSLSGTDDETERYMNMFYVKKESRYIWNDVANDIIKIVPGYEGKVGYIVEIE